MDQKIKFLDSKSYMLVIETTLKNRHKTVQKVILQLIFYMIHQIEILLYIFYANIEEAFLQSC